MDILEYPSEIFHKEEMRERVIVIHPKDSFTGKRIFLEVPLWGSGKREQNRFFNFEGKHTGQAA